MSIPSEIVLRITGNFIEDDPSPKPALLQWIQAECRTGCFKQAIENCIKAQPEPLRADLVLVEKVEDEKVTLRVPGRVADHESTSAFDVNVQFELNPATLAVKRI